jgi:hypothetical protein
MYVSVPDLRLKVAFVSAVQFGSFLFILVYCPSRMTGKCEVVKTHSHEYYPLTALPWQQL